MKDIGFLLKNIQKGQNDSKVEINSIIDFVYSTTGVKIIEKDIVFSTIRGDKKIQLQVSGAKKTLLSVNKGVLQEKLKTLHITLL